MKAILQSRYGPPSEVLRVGEMDPPAPVPGEVLVRVRAASLHPDVWHVVAGHPRILRLGAGLLRPKDPIPGTDMAGVVEAVGEGVARFQRGDAVFGETFTALQWRNGGAFAEFVAVPDECLEWKPANISFGQAAAVPTAGFITLSNLPDARFFQESREALVNGAGGGVGMLALQILKAWGAEVTAVDTTRKLELLRTLGADRVIDHTREDFTQGTERYDLIFDIPGNHPPALCQRVLKPQGRYVLIGHEHYGHSGHKILGLIPQFLYLMFLSRFDRQLGLGRKGTLTKREAMATLRDLLETGKVTPIIDRTFPLAEIHEAFRHLMEDELHGKVILTVE